MAIAISAAAALAHQGKDEPKKRKEGKDRHSGEYRWGKDGDETYFHKHGYTRLDIPKGHYPPPGECRIWFPDRPPGDQPPPVKCGEGPVPAGAWLIYHPGDMPDCVHVTVYEPKRPGKVLVAGEFKIGDGTFMRVVLDR